MQPGSGANDSNGMTMGVDEQGWTPYREPLWATLARNCAIALGVGAVITRGRGGVAAWLLASVLLLWPTLGGHYIEVWFLNWLRPRLPAARMTQGAVRMLVWFVGGMVLGMCLWWSAAMVAGVPGRGSLVPRSHPGWWLAGLALVAIELVAHAGLLLRRRPSFYDGRG